jgi:hypothetical protein
MKIPVAGKFLRGGGSIPDLLPIVFRTRYFVGNQKPRELKRFKNDELDIKKSHKTPTVTAVYFFIKN